MTTLTSGGTTLLSGGIHLTSTEEEEDDVPLAINSVADSNKFTTSTSLADLDAATDFITFTAPASGNVIVRLDGICQPDSGSTAGKFASWGLRESTTNIAGPCTVAEHPTTGNSFYVHVSCPFYITGLTPGSSHTYKWAIKASSSATHVVVGGSGEARIMSVWEAP